MKKILKLLILFYYLPALVIGNNNNITESIKFYSEIRDREYAITIIYTAGFKLNNPQKYKSIYYQDGNLYLNNIRVNLHIDSLYKGKKIGDFVSVYIQPSDRTDEFLFRKDEFADFICLELVPYIDSRFNTSSHPKDRTMIGLSYGGNISAYICYIYPEIFGNCGLQSAAFRPTFDVFRLYQNGVKKDVNFYAVWGTKESPIEKDMRLFRDNLLSKGYSFRGKEYFGEGHTFSFWASTIAKIIEYFLNVEIIVDVPKKEYIISNYQLDQNYPNPFNPSTTIKYSIANVETGYIPSVQLKVYDILGSEIITLVNKEQPPGNYEVEFDGTEFSSGIYLYIINAGDPASSAGQVYIETKKMILLK